ncbi:uncharacterized protein PITG_10326 [Phytophthora infestans T30-4]|uniref:Uncharacterized protein n=1 Tax=Phytophthora infestans (strain T30-4) TaxID=403677 RepID=D0NF24_PHYIT|nr:uncharacterized protein PITG_10326 [Phytophthora infestans T30-4]EEY56813.1 hypothetical protein PITG_10326 [Phytophthora infestans T30-4]|eukprot:XP_002902141.1 hypothetical protein PITG_10326 [Phytophthora infestans T30-4]
MPPKKRDKEIYLPEKNNLPEGITMPAVAATPTTPERLIKVSRQQTFDVSPEPKDTIVGSHQSASAVDNRGDRAAAKSTPSSRTSLSFIDTNFELRIPDGTAAFGRDGFAKKSKANRFAELIETFFFIKARSSLWWELNVLKRSEGTIDDALGRPYILGDLDWHYVNDIEERRHAAEPTVRLSNFELRTPDETAGTPIM